MRKRGQITIFLVVGILILIVVALILFLTTNTATEEVKTELQDVTSGNFQSRIISFTESCLKDVAEPGMYLLGMQGGILYLDNPKTVLLTDNALINYGYLNGVDHISTSFMERQFNTFIEKNLPSCLDDYSIFEEQGVIFNEKGSIKSDVKFVLNKAIIHIDYETKFQLAGDEVSISSYGIQLPFRVGKVVEKSKELIEDYDGNPTSITPRSTDNFFVTVHPYDKETLLYSIADEGQLNEDAPFTFMFAVKNEIQNLPPKLTFVPNFVVRKGEEFSYKADATDPNNDLLFFTTNDQVFSISPNGLLRFTIPVKGEHKFTIKVEDQGGLIDEQEVTITVEE